MMNPMTPRPRTRRQRWRRLLLAAVAAVLATLLSAGTASAATLSAAETRVGASTATAPVVVGFEAGVWASQRQVNAPPQTVPASATGVATKAVDEFVDLASAPRRAHILDGEVRPNGSYSGGHRPGTGFPKKSEFPADWSDDRIMHEISDVATDPSLKWTAGDRAGDFFVRGTRDGIDIEVLIRNNEIWTGYPTNVPRNPS